MFGARLKQELEELTSKFRELQTKALSSGWRVQELEARNSELESWLRKLRDKNSALRRERRRLRQLLEDNDITWTAGS